MPVFFVSFDLNHDDGYDHYSGFVAELNKLRGHRIMNNSCLVNIKSGSAKTLLDHLKPHLEDTDRIFAARIDSANSYFLHAYPGTNDWIKHNPLDPQKPAPASVN
ncbi:hypothetical protein [Microbulbifer sp. S227A]|uniref:hypothetical protein n=1 Tax=Microbulbifer sp. S227A TaxID=3415131 RepID=UPI003C7B797F